MGEAVAEEIMMKHPYTKAEIKTHGRRSLKEGEPTERKGYTIEKSLHDAMMAECDRRGITPSKYIRKLIRADLDIVDTE